MNLSPALLALPSLLLLATPAFAAEPTAAKPVLVEFIYDKARTNQTYECTVRLKIHDGPEVTTKGSVRPTPGSTHPTINLGKYDIQLGVHHRESILTRDVSKLSKAHYDAISKSPKTFGATTKGYLKSYKLGKDGKYSLADDADEARGWMRKVLTIADPATDSLIVEATPNNPRLCLVLEKDALTIPVTYPEKAGEPGVREARKANAIHIHSGPDERRGAVGCLTIPESRWASFLAPVVEKFPCADDWVSRGMYGKDVGQVIITSK